MTLRSRYLLAALVTLRMALPAPAQQAFVAGPSQPVSSNQQVATTIAEQIRQSRQLHGYTIDVVYQDGVAQLNGRVADQPQCEAAQRIAQAVPGVDHVQNNLILVSAVVPVQAPAPIGPAPVPVAPVPPRPLPPVPANGGPMEPMPIFQAAFPGPYDGGGPPVPPYAWPTYAPYNNYSRVAYPTAYPYNAWPFIGPCYPFPKIPLGWRSVKLEWEDGYWWFSKTATKYDWWRLRYW